LVEISDSGGHFRRSCKVGYFIRRIGDSGFAYGREKGIKKALPKKNGEES
jgi:hypothetical protein